MPDFGVELKELASIDFFDFRLAFAVCEPSLTSSSNLISLSVDIFDKVGFFIILI
jgi:hypothetical protein